MTVVSSIYRTHFKQKISVLYFLSLRYFPHIMVGYWNPVLRHSEPHFSPNFGVAEPNVAPFLLEQKK